MLRHGETELNRLGMVQGRGVDAPLNGVGKAQAEKVYHHFKGKIDRIYTSSLLRSQQTVEEFRKEDLQIIPLAGFDEISWGNQEGNVATMEAKNLYSETVMGWQRGELHLNVGGGENPIQVMERQQEAMEVVLNDEANTILICMHGRALRILLCWVLNYPLNYMDGFPHRNCSFYQLNQLNSSFVVKEFNQSAHLD